MRVLVTGAGGMVGRAVAEHCAAQGDDVLAYEHRSLNIADEAAVAAVFEQAQAETVINCAAWTDVDGCELDAARAFASNATGPENLAKSCRRTGASLVTISTDFVFDGVKSGFYTQRDDPNPLSVYGASKLEGERRAQSGCARTIVARTAWVFGDGGRNFLSKVVELTRSGNPLKVINDAYGTPTYAVDLAARLRRLAELDLPGVYHVTGGGEGASYEEFARAAIGMAGLESAAPLVSVSMDELERPAPRPRNSRLRCILSEAVGLPPLRDWQSALGAFINRDGQDEGIGDFGLPIAD